MYTRSYSSRRQMPPDYGGTALTFKPPHTEEQILVQTKTENDVLFPRKPLFYKKENEDENEISAPFGKRGQDEAGLNRAKAELTSYEPPHTKESPLPSLFDIENLKNDDLLLLGIAFMLLAEKNNDLDNVPTDALLILAMLYLSGL